MQAKVKPGNNYASETVDGKPIVYSGGEIVEVDAAELKRVPWCLEPLDEAEARVTAEHQAEIVRLEGELAAARGKADEAGADVRLLRPRELTQGDVDQITKMIDDAHRETAEAVDANRQLQEENAQLRAQLEAKAPATPAAPTLSSSEGGDLPARQPPAVDLEKPSAPSLPVAEAPAGDAAPATDAPAPADAPASSRKGKGRS